MKMNLIKPTAYILLCTTIALAQEKSELNKNYYIIKNQRLFSWYNKNIFDFEKCLTKNQYNFLNLKARENKARFLIKESKNHQIDPSGFEIDLQNKKEEEKKIKKIFSTVIANAKIEEDAINFEYYCKNKVATIYRANKKNTIIAEAYSANKKQGEFYLEETESEQQQLNNFTKIEKAWEIKNEKTKIGTRYQTDGFPIKLYDTKIFEIIKKTVDEFGTPITKANVYENNSIEIYIF